MLGGKINGAKVEIKLFTYYSRRFTSCTSSSVPYIMESLKCMALFSLLDKEKQQMLLSQVNLIPPQKKEMGQGASVRVSPAQQCEEKSAPAVNSFTAEELLVATVGKVHMDAQKYFKR